MIVNYWLFALTSFCCAGVGFTLLNYSADGDLKNRKRSKLSKELISDEEAWQKLKDLSTYSATEVTWNTSLFVAVVSAFGFLGLLSFAQELKYEKELPGSITNVLWILSLFLVFAMQDIVQRWKTAHRKQPMTREIESLFTRFEGKFLHKKNL